MSHQPIVPWIGQRWLNMRLRSTLAPGPPFLAGVQVAIDQLAVIPAALATTPPTYGQVTVSAHALEPGPQGNIPVRDINHACCLPSVLAQNTVAFQGGQHERDYTVVTREDIDQGVASLTSTLIQSEHAAFTAQLAA